MAGMGACEPRKVPATGVVKRKAHSSSKTKNKMPGQGMIEGSKSHYEVIVVGAGVAGIYQIKRLVDLGVDALVLDATPVRGGTWY